MTTVSSVQDITSPSRHRFSQADLDSLCVHFADHSLPSTPQGKCSESKADGFGIKSELKDFEHSDEYGDMQLLAVKRDKEFPNLYAISKVAEKRKLGPKVQVGLTQRELDELCFAKDSAESLGEQNAEACVDTDEIINARDDKLLYSKRSRAYGGTADGGSSDERLDGSLLQAELDTICKKDDGRMRASTGSTKCGSSSDESSEEKEHQTMTKEDSQEEADSQEEEEDSFFVKKKKTRTYLERPRVAPRLGVCLGFSQPQLDNLTSLNEADPSVPEPQSSPHGSALLAIKRTKFYKHEKLEPMTLTSKMQLMEQAELDALCVDAADEDETESMKENEFDPTSPQGTSLCAIKRSRSYSKDKAIMAGSLLCALDPEPKMETNQAELVLDQSELDALCVDAEDDDEMEGSQGSVAKKVEPEEEEPTWSPWNSPRRSNTSSPRGEHRSPSPGHGGA